MPRIIDPTYKDNCCYCGKQAYWISVNTKRKRCEYYPSRCPALILKAETARREKLNGENLVKKMKQMSKKGNARLNELHKDALWVEQKSKTISNKVKQRGGHKGKNNPMYGKKHTPAAIKKQKERAALRKATSYIQASATKVKRGLSVPKNQKSDWQLYKEKISSLTRFSYNKYKQHVNPLNLDAKRGYELDHKFSKYKGFLNNIDPAIISHPANLEMIEKSQNRSKSSKCSITLETLLESIYKFDSKINCIQ
jgi:hypothetical protein